jgi:hypothetical protein
MEPPASPTAEEAADYDGQHRLRLQVSYPLASLDCASSMCVLPGGHLLIANTGSHRLVVVDPENGELISSFGKGLDFRGPRGLVQDGTHLYVADCYNCVIKKILLADGSVQGTAGTYGVGDGQLRYPHGLALSPDRSILYVADASNARICAFDAATLGFRFSFGMHGGPQRTTQLLQALGEAAARTAQPRAQPRPAGLAVLGDELFVTDAYNRRLQVFSLTGAFRRFLQPSYMEGSLRGKFVLTLAEGIAAMKGRLYVADKRGDAVHVLAPVSGACLQVLPFLVQKPHGLAGICTDGLRVFAVDEIRAEVQVLTSHHAEGARGKGVVDKTGTPGPTPRTSGGASRSAAAAQIPRNNASATPRTSSSTPRHQATPPGGGGGRSAPPARAASGSARDSTPRAMRASSSGNRASPPLGGVPGSDNSSGAAPTFRTTAGPFDGGGSGCTSAASQSASDLPRAAVGDSLLVPSHGLDDSVSSVRRGSLASAHPSSFHPPQQSAGSPPPFGIAAARAMGSTTAASRASPRAMANQSPRSIASQPPRSSPRTVASQMQRPTPAQVLSALKPVQGFLHQWRQRSQNKLKLEVVV